MTIGKFTLTGKVNQVGKDSADAGIDQDKTALTGWTGILTSNYPKGVPLPDGSDIDYVRVRTVTLLSDGSITEDGTNAGISLTAHDPAVFATPLQWTIKPGVVTLDDGSTLRPKAWTFNAPLDGTSVTLGGLTPVAGIPLHPAPGDTPWDSVTGKPAFIAAGATAADARAAIGVSGSGAEWESYANLAAFPVTGNANLEYVAQDTGKLYRWNGSAYIQIADKASVGLGAADNTSDANKPVSTAQQTALNLKAPLASPTFTGTVAGITKTMVGLGNNDNTSDVNKPVSTAQQAALDLKSPLGAVKPGVKGGKYPILRQRDLPKVDSFNWGGIPITETIDTSGAVTTISSAVTVTMPNASRVQPGGGDTLHQSVATPGTALMFDWQYPDHAPGVTPVAPNGYTNPRGWFVQFDIVGCTEIEFGVYNATSGSWWLMIDGRFVTQLPRTGGLSSNHFNNIKFAMPDTGVHRIRFYMSSLALGHIYVNAGATIWARPLAGPRLMFLGDSLTQGGNQDTGDSLGSWIWKTAHMLGIDNVLNAGRATTGYIADASDTSANYVTRITSDVVPAAPDILVITSFYNDLIVLGSSAAAIATALDTVLTTMAAQLPNTMVIIIGSWDALGVNGTNYTDVDTALKAKCLAHGVPYVQATTGSVYDGAGNLVVDGVTTAAPWITTNNKPTLTGGDNTHYNDVGKEFFTHRIYDAIRALLPA